MHPQSLSHNNPTVHAPFPPWQEKWKRLGLNVWKRRINSLMLTHISLTPVVTNVYEQRCFIRDDEGCVLLLGSHRDLFACCCAKQFPFCPQCLTHKGSGWKCRVCRRAWWDFRPSANLWTTAGKGVTGQSCSFQLFLSNIQTPSLHIWTC